MIPSDYVLYAGACNFSQPRIECENNANGDPIYYGFAPRGTLDADASWIITKIDYDGSGNFLREKTSPPRSKWTDRATLTYA